MAPSERPLTTKVASGSPYQLDDNQVRSILSTMGIKLSFV